MTRFKTPFRSSLSRMSAVAAIALSVLAVPALADDEGDVKGVVKDSDGSAVRDATVRLLHRDRKGNLEEVDRDTSNSDGQFSFEDVKDGTYVVVGVRKEQRDRTTVTVKNGRDVEDVKLSIRSGSAFEEEAAAARAERRPRRAERRDAADSRREKGYTNLTGTIYNGKGKPAPDATVRLMTGDGDKETEKMVEVAKTTTDSRGQFSFTKIPATHYILVATKGDEKVRHTVNLNANNKTEDVKFKME